MIAFCDVAAMQWRRQRRQCPCESCHGVQDARGEAATRVGDLEGALEACEARAVAAETLARERMDAVEAALRRARKAEAKVTALGQRFQMVR